MNQTEKKEIHNKIIKGLQSNDSKTVLDSITQLREEGELNDLKLLFDLLTKTNDEKVKESILNFIADIKEKNAAPIIIDAIADKDYKQIRKDLIGTCWQSSIDFTNYISVFTDLLFDIDFQIAFEAFTVIENFTGKLSEEQKQSEKDKLKNGLPQAAEEMKGMIHECIHLIDEM